MKEEQERTEGVKMEQLTAKEGDHRMRVGVDEGETATLVGNTTNEALSSKEKRAEEQPATGLEGFPRQPLPTRRLLIYEEIDVSS